eukprot:5882707-Pleurochrysis_carterae.AAC.1
MRACKSNLSCACIAHFVYKFALLFKSLRDGVRANGSKQLDLCWRDFLAMDRTTDSNKTQCCQMAIVHIYWGLALNEPLRSVYHSIRSLKLVHSNVMGWDMFIERVNLSIQQSNLISLVNTCPLFCDTFLLPIPLIGQSTNCLPELMAVIAH